MSFDSGTRTVLSEAFMWGIGLAALAAVAMHAEALVETATGAADAPAAVSARASSSDAETPQQTGAAGTVELQAGENGHFHADAEINGQTVHVLVDTGASMVALSYEDAESAGLYLKPRDFTHRVSTANGYARVAPVTLDSVSIGDITVRNVRAAVSERGALSMSLLGMTFLGQLQRVDMRSGTLVLQD